MNDVTIEVQRREGTGKSAARRLRKAEMIPAVLYGGEREPVAIQVPRKMMITLFKSGGSDNRIFLLKLSGTDQTRHAMIRDLQVDPITNQVAHIDFQRIDMKKSLRVKVAVELLGIAYGVKTEGGLLDFVTRELEVECLPGAIPQKLVVDINEVHVGQHLEAKDVVLPEGVSLVGEPDRVLLSVGHARVETEGVEAAAPAAEGTEPEVIQRGKKEEEGES